MPIPSSVKSFQIDATDAAAKRPILAVEAARIFAMWANVEYVLGTMSSVLIGDKLALVLLDRIRSRSAKLDAVQAAAAEKVAHEETRGLLKPLFRLVNKAAEPRNQLAHSMWGTIPELPDALLLTEPAAMLKATRIVSQAEGKRTTQVPAANKVTFEHASTTPIDTFNQVDALLRENTQVWRQPDFDRPRQLLRGAIVALTQYTVAVTAQPESAGAIEARTQLAAHLADTERKYY